MDYSFRGYLVEPIKFLSTPLFLYMFYNLYFVRLFAFYKGIPCENLSPDWTHIWPGVPAGIKAWYLVEDTRTLSTVPTLVSAQKCITPCSRNLLYLLLLWLFLFYLVSSEGWTNDYNRSCGWHNFIRRERDLTGRTHRPLTTTRKRKKENRVLHFESILILQQSNAKSKPLMVWRFENLVSARNQCRLEEN